MVRCSALAVAVVDPPAAVASFEGAAEIRRGFPTARAGAVPGPEVPSGVHRSLQTLRQGGAEVPVGVEVREPPRGRRPPGSRGRRLGCPPRRELLVLRPPAPRAPPRAPRPGTRAAPLPHPVRRPHRGRCPKVAHCVSLTSEVSNAGGGDRPRRGGTRGHRARAAAGGGSRAGGWGCQRPAGSPFALALPTGGPGTLR